jgi:hypothetical protein
MMTARKHHAFKLACVLTIAVLASGCLYSREIQHTRRDIERANPGLELDRTFSASVGPVGIRLARWITSLIDDDDVKRARRYLSSVRRVKVGVYDARGEGPGSLARLSELRRFERRGWELAAHVSEDDEEVWLFYRDRSETVTDLYAVVLSDDELVIARIQGNLTELLAEALKDYGPDLADWD